MLLSSEPGYVGSFTREEAKGAWKNGTRVVKAIAEPGDTWKPGDRGVVLGSVMDREIWYFVEYDSDPKVAVGVRGKKLRRDHGAPF